MSEYIPGSASVVDSNGRQVFTAHFEHVLTNHARGFVDRIVKSGSRLQIRGWVTDLGSNHETAYVTALIGGRSLNNAAQDFLVRPDVNEQFGLSSETRSGFTLAGDLPSSLFSKADLTIVAVFRSGKAFAVDHSGAIVTEYNGGPAPSWAKKFRAELYPFPADSPFAGIYSLASHYDIANLTGVTSQFLENASVYHAKYDDHPLWTSLLLNAVGSIAGFAAPREVLDIGSGSGNTVIPLFRLYPEVRIVAVDISPQLLAILRDRMTPDQRDRCLLVAADASDPIFQRDSFDLVIGGAILHHILDPSRTIASCLQALNQGCYAIFFEPFEAGAAMLRLLYGRLIEKSEALGLSHEVTDAFQRLSYDFAVRAGQDKSAPIYRDLDDKWLFTRSYFEDLKDEMELSDISIRPLYDMENPFASQVKTHLRLCLGAGPEALPEAAWNMIEEFEQTFSPGLRRELLIEAAVLLRKAGRS